MHSFVHSHHRGFGNVKVPISQPYAASGSAILCGILTQEYFLRWKGSALNGQQCYRHQRTAY